MLFAVPSSSSLAAFFVLQVALLFTASFHFGRSLTHNPQFHSAFIRFSPLAVQRLLLIFGSPAVASGLRAVSGFGNISLYLIYIFKSPNPRQPLCSTYIGRQRSHFTSFRCVLFCLPPFAPFAFVRISAKLGLVPAATHCIHCSLHFVLSSRLS